MAEPNKPITVAGRAIVTGASGTVGSACARALHDAGWPLILLGRRRQALSELADELAGPTTGQSPVSRPGVEIMAGDATDRQVIQRLTDELAAGSPERLVLVNAAATHGPLATVAEVDLAEWEQTFEVNFLTLVRLVAALAPLMLQAGWGRVVQVSSAASLAVPAPRNSAYSVSKAAGNRFLGHLAAEVTGTGVTVHAVHPGELVSNMWRDIAGQAAGDPELAGFSRWARQTAERPDDPRAVGQWVVDLIDDQHARDLHGSFGWAQQPERPPIPLA